MKRYALPLPTFPCTTMEARKDSFGRLEIGVDSMYNDLIDKRMKNRLYESLYPGDAIWCWLILPVLFADIVPFMYHNASQMPYEIPDFYDLMVKRGLAASEWFSIYNTTTFRPGCLGSLVDSDYLPNGVYLIKRYANEANTFITVTQSKGK